MKCSFEQRSLSIVSKLAMVFVMILISISLCQLKPIEKAYAYQDGWSNDGSYWYYYANGSPVSGWQHIYHSGQWDDYYFVNGVMQTGWLSWDGSWFYLADGYGQDVGFYDVDYGTCRMGWQNIYHSYGVWDYYYF